MNFPDLLTLAVTIIIAITVHEFSHALVATFLGDPTAKNAGRLSLNPLVHIDPLGLIMLFLVHFGWGKPTPYNPHNLHNPRLGGLLIAIAGPISNLLLAIIFAFFAKQFGFSSWFGEFLVAAVFINLGLAVFNLIPIHPLDGTKILAYFIPVQFQETFESYVSKGPFILLGIILFERVTGIALLSPIISTAIEKIALLISLAI